MLNGVDPIIIFDFKKIIPTLLEPITSIPIVAAKPTTFPLPLIPIYLSERLTGVYIDTEGKSLEIDTSIDAKTNGAAPDYNQRVLSSTIKVEMKGKRDSIGVMLFSAMADLILQKVVSKEYSITYLHGAITVFAGLLHSLNITQSADNDLLSISLELQKPPGGAAAAAITQVTPSTGLVPLSGGG